MKNNHFLVKLFSLVFRERFSQNGSKVNKKGDVEIDKVIILVLAIIALIAVFVFVKSSLSESIETFLIYIKEIFK